MMANKLESYYLPRFSFLYSIELLVPLPVITKKKKKKKNCQLLLPNLSIGNSKMLTGPEREWLHDKGLATSYCMTFL